MCDDCDTPIVIDLGAAGEPRLGWTVVGGCTVSACRRFVIEPGPNGYVGRQYADAEAPSPVAASPLIARLSLAKEWCERRARNTRQETDRGDED